MNEQIKKIAKDAGVLGDWGEDVLEGRFFITGNTEQMEKFAELIIKEHIDLLRNEWYELNNQPVIENESPRDIGLRVGRKIEINVLLEKIRKHWNIEP